MLVPNLYRLAMPSERYPEKGSMFRAELPERARRFADAREHFLLDYGYNTARAYWSDLDDIFAWCERRGFDIFGLDDHSLAQYTALMRRRKYSENTVRRRITAWKGLIRSGTGT